MSHSQNLKRVSREHVIDLYLQPPVGKFRLMDFHLMERLVRDANRQAASAFDPQCSLNEFAALPAFHQDSCIARNSLHR